jgi:hypothetical protein
MNKLFEKTAPWTPAKTFHLWGFTGGNFFYKIIDEHKENE